MSASDKHFIWSPTWSLTEAITLVIWVFNGRVQTALITEAQTTVASSTGIHKILISQQVSSIEREENYSVSKIQFLVNVGTDEQLLLATIKL